MKRQFKWILILGISLLVGAVFSVSTDFNMLLRKNDRAGYTEEEEIQTVLIKGSGSLTVLFSDEGKPGEGRYVNRLKLTLYPREERPLSLTAIVTYLTEDGKAETLTIEDTNPLYVKQEVLRIRKDHVISVDLSADGGSFSVGDIRVDNDVHFNFLLFLTGVLLTFPVLYLLFFRKGMDEKVLAKRGFIVTSLSLGALLILTLPSGKVGNDEEAHLRSVLVISSFPSNELHISDGVLNQVSVTEYNNPTALPVGTSEKYEYENRLNQDADYKTGARAPEFTVNRGWILSYLPMAAAMKAAKGLSLSWRYLIMAARFANLFVYTALVALALTFLPKGHLLMAFLALLPENLFLSSTVSYDPWVTGFLFLGSSIFYRLMLAPEDDSKKEMLLYFGMLAAFFLGCLPKAVYAPVILVSVLVPIRHCPDKKRRNMFLLASAFTCLLTVALFIAPTLIAPSNTGDVRGSAEVSEAGQIDFIFGNPFRYTYILLRQMVTWVPQTLLGPDCTTFMGHLVNGGTESKGIYEPYYLVLLLTGIVGIGHIAAKKGRTEGLKLWERLVVLFLCFGAACLVWTSMYVAYTKPGAEWIDGVQGRYFIPLFFLIYSCLWEGTENKAEALLEKRLEPLSKGAAKLVTDRRLWYDMSLVVTAVLAGLNVLCSVVLPYCL